MKVEYIHHDGFAVGLSGVSLLFDYWNHPLPAFDPQKPLYVFASHVHPDHFSFRIFDLSEKLPNVRYFLSNDIHRKFGQNSFLRHGVSEKACAAVTFLKANEEFSEDGLRIRTLPSTDEGVAFMVSCMGNEIYHAGDLNDWSFEENDEKQNRLEKESYRRIIDTIAGTHFDLAFVPLDPRLGKYYCHGFDYFMRHTDTDIVYPMHRFGDTSVLARFLKDDVSIPYRGKIRSPEDSLS